MFDLSGSTHITVDHSEVRAFAQKYRGRPQRLGENGYSTIRIDFPGKDDDRFLSEEKPPVNISWDKFFNIFEQQDLAFIFEDKDIYDPSLAYHFIKRESAFASENNNSFNRIFG